MDQKFTHSAGCLTTTYVYRPSDDMTNEQLEDNDLNRVGVSGNLFRIKFFKAQRQAMELQLESGNVIHGRWTEKGLVFLLGPLLPIPVCACGEGDFRVHYEKRSGVFNLWWEETNGTKNMTKWVKREENMTDPPKNNPSNSSSIAPSNLLRIASNSAIGTALGVNSAPAQERMAPEPDQDFVEVD